MRWLVIALLFVFGTVAGLAWYVRQAPPLDDVAAALAKVHKAPRSVESWLALGDAQAALDDLGAAEHAFRTAVEVAPETDGRPAARLGFLLYQQGRDVQARRWLTLALARGAQAPLLRETLESLTPTGDTAPNEAAAVEPPPVALDAGIPVDAGPASLDAASAPLALNEAAQEETPDALSESPSESPGACAVPLQRTPSGGLLVDVAMNGALLTLLVDTGATMTVINDSAARRAGIARVPGRLIAQTANGITEMALGHVTEVALEDRFVEDARVAVCDECIQFRADGLLGVDLQAAFDVQVDVVGRRLAFTDCY